jgi:hypothetical protein
MFLVRLAAIWHVATSRPASFSRRGDHKDATKEPLDDIGREAYDASLDGYSGPFFAFLKLVTATLAGFDKLSDHSLVGAFRRATRNVNSPR